MSTAEAEPTTIVSEPNSRDLSEFSHLEAGIAKAKEYLTLEITDFDDKEMIATVTKAHKDVRASC